MPLGLRGNRRQGSEQFGCGWVLRDVFVDVYDPCWWRGFRHLSSPRMLICLPNTGDQLQSPTQRRWRGGSEHDRRALLQEFPRALSAASPRWATAPPPLGHLHARGVRESLDPPRRPSAIAEPAPRTPNHAAMAAQ